MEFARSLHIDRHSSLTCFIPALEGPPTNHFGCIGVYHIVNELHQKA
jgi:hypothetical protein